MLIDLSPPRGIGTRGSGSAVKCGKASNNCCTGQNALTWTRVNALTWTTIRCFYRRTADLPAKSRGTPRIAMR